MPLIFVVLLINFFCFVGFVSAKNRGFEAQEAVQMSKDVVSIVKQDGNIIHDGKFLDAKKSIDIAADNITIKNASYKTAIITLMAAMSIKLANSTFKGVLQVDGATILIQDCVIKSLVITNYEKVKIRLCGNTVIEEGIQFIGDYGQIEADPTVTIRGAIENGERK